MPQIYYAKSPAPDGSQETVRAHCQKVSKQAALYGAPLALAEEARLCGLYHDFGKYSQSFQGVLQGTHSGIDHAFSVAALCDHLTKGKLPAAVEVINGHHDGLHPFHSIKDYIRQSQTERFPVYCNTYKASALSGVTEYNQAITAIISDFPTQGLKYRPTVPLPVTPDNLSAMLDTRMLFSCLVDADYTVSSGQDDAPSKLDARALLDALYDHCKKLRASSTADPQLNQLRDYLFDRCGQTGEAEGPGLFTLTAPTGTGKTLALLHFALRHCLAHPNTRRIILVLPFLTLTEQSAKDYMDAGIPDILQDHSQSNLDEAAREHAAKWDSPFIITTSVKFFESLFAQRPTDCRKLHNIANSVILFDEAQSLPANLTTATLGAIDRLCSRFGCTMVLSTATQPDYSPLDLPRWSPKEILPDHANLFRQTCRTRAIWNLHTPTPLEEIACQMAQSDNVCTIVNLRAHARTLYSLLKEQCPQDEVFFLTTDLCPAHRTELVKNLKARQQAGLPCRVVSTQCIEAGVDLDFSVLYRALAPLESIIQAAGRCNRNGRASEPGRVTIFIPDVEGRLYPDEWYMTAAELVKELLHDRGGQLDLHDPANIRAYYQRLFPHQLDKPSLTKAIGEQSYEAAAQEYRLISQDGWKVLVPYANQLKLYQELKDEAQKIGITASWLKRAAPITVSTFEHLEAPVLGFPVERQNYAKKRGYQDIPSDVWVLSTGSEKSYQADMGLQLSKEENFLCE